ncbi:MAG: CDP-alcohol phosphatidyltransferase family protein [Nanoarchaeota archaeon]|nr:CDP-alcohol phosphatidyltransferase family protein [Nanoarchaeota archaeon]
MVTINELREKCKKEYWGFSNKLVHEIGFYFTKPFINTPITSNQVTLFWLFLGLAGAVLLSTGLYKWMLLGIVIYHLGHFFDCVDGNLARYRNKSTLKGQYLEQIAHHITIIAVLCGLTLGTYKMTNDLRSLYLGGIAVGAFVFAKLFNLNLISYKGEQRERVAEIMTQLNPRKRSKLTVFIFGFVRIEHPLNLMFFCILLNQPFVGLACYAAMHTIEMVKKLATTLIKLQKADDDFFSAQNK